jgi:hypothetical protein
MRWFGWREVLVIWFLDAVGSDSSSVARLRFAVAK